MGRNDVVMGAPPREMGSEENTTVFRRLTAPDESSSKATCEPYAGGFALRAVETRHQCCKSKASFPHPLIV